MADFYRVTFHVPCRQCALMLFRAALDAHGYRVTCGAVSERKDNGEEWVIAHVGAYTSIPPGMDVPCNKHLPRLGVRDD